MNGTLNSTRIALLGIILTGAIVSAAAPAQAGDYLGTARWEFLRTGGTEPSAILNCAVTHVGGPAFSFDCMVAGLGDYHEAPAACTASLGPSWVSMYCWTYLQSSSTDETAVTHVIMNLDLTLAGPYMFTSLRNLPAGLTPYTELGTVRFLGP